MTCTPFGCGTLTVTFSEPDGPPICADLPVVAVRGEYTTDDTSFAQVELEGFCCDLCPDLRPLYHELTIWRDGIPVWFGPIPPFGISTTDTGTVVEAVDRSFWHLNQRVSTTTNTVAGQPEQLFVDSWEEIDPTHPGQAPAIVTTNAAFGADVETLQGEETFRPLELLARDAVDWSTIGAQTWVGAPNIDPGLPVLDLSDVALVSPAGRGFAGTGVTSASILSVDDDGNDVETFVETDATPWTLHVSDNGSSVDDPTLAALGFLDPFPRRSLVVNLAALSEKAAECDLTRLVPGRRVLVSSSCAADDVSEQIIESVVFEWVRNTGDPLTPQEIVSVGTIASADRAA